MSSPDWVPIAIVVVVVIGVGLLLAVLMQVLDYATWWLWELTCELGRRLRARLAHKRSREGDRA